MIRIDLTSSQMKQLQKHFKVVNACASIGERGTLAAQVHEDWDGWTGYIRVHFIPYSRVGPVIEAVRNARIPNGYAGIPAVQHSGEQT